MDKIEQVKLNWLFNKAIQNKDLENAKLLISQIDIDYVNFIMIQYMSQCMTYHFNLDNYNIIKFFLENKADPNIGFSANYNKNIFHLATEYLLFNTEHIEYIEKLILLILNNGGDPNKKDSTYYQSTPWKNMYKSDNIKLLKLFLEKNADYDYFCVTVMKLIYLFINFL